MMHHIIFFIINLFTCWYSRI